MSTRNLIILLLVAALLLAAGWRAHIRFSVPALRAAVESQLPAGTPSTRVKLFLDSLKIPYSELASDHRSDGTRWTLAASIQDLRRPHLLADGVFLRFRFDDQFHLLASDVHESWTMP